MFSQKNSTTPTNEDLKKKSVIKGCPLLDLNQSLEETVMHPIATEEPEYGCNFCPKKYSNKQALGGHQNAHKLDKAGQKRPRQGCPGNAFSPNSFHQVPKMNKRAHYIPYLEHQSQPLRFGGFWNIPEKPFMPQMHAPASMFRMPGPFMGRGASASNERSTGAVANSDEAGRHGHIQHPEDGLDLSLKL